MSDSLERRARLHAALGDPHRLAIVDELSRSDRTPSQLGERCGLGSNLVAHHLHVLTDAGLVERFPSSGDRRRRYVRLRREPLIELGALTARPAGAVLFVCTQNSARSQLAAALWTDRTGQRAESAGTEPADEIHPGAVAAAERAGLDLQGRRPSSLTDADQRSVDVVVTVCDRAYEELSAPDGWWHWSTPDPVTAGSPAAFDEVLADLDARIKALV